MIDAIMFVCTLQLVQARGCAYIVMVHRADAVRALNTLKDLKLNGNTCKVKLRSQADTIFFAVTIYSMLRSQFFVSLPPSLPFSLSLSLSLIH